MISDDDAYADVQAELAGLAFLRPDAELDPVEIPDGLWDRLDAALAAESTARSEQARPNRSSRWAGGLVAASVVILALGVAGVALRGGGASPDIVAGDAQPTQLIEAPAVAAAAPEAAPLTQPAADSAPGTSTKVAPASFSAPVKQMRSTGTKYTKTALTTQVASLLDGMDVHTPAEVSAMPGQEAPLEYSAAGFTASAEELQDCITKLTHAAGAWALVVDMASFQGQEAGIVVAPVFTATGVIKDIGRLDVWVVTEDCTAVEPKVTLDLP